LRGDTEIFTNGKIISNLSMIKSTLIMPSYGLSAINLNVFSTSVGFAGASGFTVENFNAYHTINVPFDIYFTTGLTYNITRSINLNPISFVITNPTYWPITLYASGTGSVNLILSGTESNCCLTNVSTQVDSRGGNYIINNLSYFLPSGASGVTGNNGGYWLYRDYATHVSFPWIN
jgi:hypothetical protein